MRLHAALALALALALAAAPAHAQFGLGGNTSGGPLHPEQATFDVTYVRLDLAVRPGARTIGGTMTMDATVAAPTAVVRLDLDPALAVERADELPLAGGPGGPGPGGPGVERRVERLGGAFRVHLGRTAQPGERLRLRVAYGGTPHVAVRPPWDGGVTWSETADGRPWVAVSCQGEGADRWWPVKDHPSDEPDSVRVALTVPAGLRGIANGRWEGRVDHGDGTATETWVSTSPINAYGVSFGVGPYETVERTYASPLGHTMPAAFYVLPEHRADMERQADGFLDALAFAERTFGPYGWRADGYHVLHTPYLGMEHQSLVAYGSTFEDNAYGFDWLHFHEMAHEWWANLGTAADWRDFWIHESFASYAEALYAEDLARRGRGPEGVAPEAAYLAYIADVRGRIVNQIAVAPRESRTTTEMYNLPGGGSNGDIYFKGSWMLHTLRYALDDDAAFLGAFRDILYPTPESLLATDGSQARFLSTADVQRAFERAAGRSLDGVFEVYLRQPALPRLAVERGPAAWTLRWELPEAAAGAVFEVPVPVRVGGRDVRVAMPGGAGRLPVPQDALVEIDPDGRILFER